MSELVRGLVLLASVLLWLPFLGPVLGGALSVEQGLLRYLAALLLTWAGAAGLGALVRSYSAGVELSEESERVGRRKDDGT